MRELIWPAPKKWQKDVHDYITEIGPKAGSIIVVKSKRQVGKSFLLMGELLRHALNYAGSTSILVSITYKNTAKIFAELYNGLIDTGLLRKANASGMVFEFINGSTIYMLSAAQRESLRGFTVSRGGILVIDEAAYLGDEIFNIISPYVDANSANILMVSTPRLRQGFFYDYFILGVSGEQPNVRSFDWSEYDTSCFLSHEKLELYRKVMPKNQFRSEYLGEFVDDSAGVFDISKDIWLNVPVTDYRKHTKEWITVGIDWGTGQGQDATVITGFTDDKKQALFARCTEKSPVEQIEWIANILDGYNIRQIRCESNSIGSVYIDMLRRKVSAPIVEFVTNNDSKRRIIENLIVLIQNEHVKIFKDKEIYLELANYMLEMTSSGKITYNGAAGIHDDCVMSIAIALDGIGSAQYNVSVLTHKHSDPRYRAKYN